MVRNAVHNTFLNTLNYGNAVPIILSGWLFSDENDVSTRSPSK